MSATVKVHCPNCSQPYSIPVERLGKQAQCEQCNTVFTLENPNLAPCPDCFANISRRALTCPRCGAPLRSEAFQVGGQTAASVPYDVREEKTVFVGNPAAMYYFFNFLIGVITIPFIVGIFNHPCDYLYSVYAIYSDNKTSSC